MFFEAAISATISDMNDLSRGDNRCAIMGNQIGRGQTGWTGPTGYNWVHAGRERSREMPCASVLFFTTILKLSEV